MCIIICRHHPFLLVLLSWIALAFQTPRTLANSISTNRSDAPFRADLGCRELIIFNVIWSCWDHRTVSRHLRVITNLQPTSNQGSCSFALQSKARRCGIMIRPGVTPKCTVCRQYVPGSFYLFLMSGCLHPPWEDHDMRCCAVLCYAKAAPAGSGAKGKACQRA